MVEAVIVAPVLILIFVGATYVRALYLARGESRLDARRCAWENAMDGCDQMPSSCAVDAQSTSGTAEPEAEPDIASVARSQTSTGDLDPFADIPIVGSAFQMLFGTTTHTEVERDVPFPLDSERIGVARGSTVVLCNARNETVESVAMQFLENALADVGL